MSLEIPADRQKSDASSVQLRDRTPVYFIREVGICSAH